MRVCVIIPPASELFDQKTNVPLGPLYIAAMLERAEHEVTLISLLGHDIPAVWPSADLYAMGFTTPQVGAAKGIMELIRSQHPKAKVLAAGAHPTALPAETLQLGFDSVLVGEGEVTIRKVMADLPYLGKVYFGVAASFLDQIPFPARHLLPREDLYNDGAAVFRGAHEGEHVTSIMGSRGCADNCAFCGNSPLGKLRHRSAGNIIAEMKAMVELGITCFKFQDDTFAILPEKVIALGEAAQNEFGPGVIATRMHTRVNRFPEKILPALRQLDTEIVAFGMESGSQTVLDISRKRITIEQSESALRLAHDAGLKTLGLFMFGLPGECEETVDETIEFWRRNRTYMDAANLTVFVPYPGCDIAERPDRYRMHILERDWNRYWLVGKSGVHALPYDVSFQEMLDLKKKAFDAFVELGYAKPDWENDL